MRRLATLFGLLVFTLGGTSPTLGASPDVVVTTLRSSDVFVSPAVGTDPVAATAVLSASAMAAQAAGEPVKFAVVPGPAGAPSMLAYARALRRDLRFRGRVIASAPGRPVAVAGPDDRAKTTLALRNAKVGKVQDVIERAVAAERATQASARTPARGGSVRGLLGLLGIALIGGVWAVAIGMRRRQGVDRQRFHVARSAVSDGLDELASCIERAEPAASSQAPTPSAIDLAAREYAAAREEFERAQDLPALVGTGARVRGALQTVERAGVAPATEITTRLDQIAALPPLP